MNPLAADTTAFLLLGFLLGLKHALDADHLIAISTIVSERRGWLSSGITGALWGIGHTAALLAVGVVVTLLGLHIPDKLAIAMELAVALMLIILGANVLRQLWRGGTVHLHVHSHDGTTHIHPHVHTVEETQGHDIAHFHHSFSLAALIQRTTKHIHKGRRTVLIGMVHGMAGSAALMLIVLAALPSATLRLLYVTVFGIGSIGGMLMMSMVVGLPFLWTANRFGKLNSAVRGLAGFVSVGFGVYLAWQIGIAEQLFF